MKYEFGEPKFNEEKDGFEAPIVPVQENEDQWEWQQQEEFRRNELRNRIDEILSEKAVAQEWLIWKMYYFLYFRKNFEVHINRVKTMIYDWISASTYEQLIEARIITEEDVISNYNL